MKNPSKKVALIILDGWGIAPSSKANGISQAQTPCFSNVLKNYPSTTLEASGLAVGLPEGQMGNSEVGHLNLGSGQIIYQELVKINLAIQTKRFFELPAVHEIQKLAHQNTNRAIHIMGLLSNGGIHSDLPHLEALIEVCSTLKNPVYIHAFTDGRDTSPQSGIEFIKILQKKITQPNIRLVSLIGRYYAMDRDQRWERIQKAYQLLVKREGNLAFDPVEALYNYYDKGITDEFIPATKLPYFEPIKEDDIVICYNFRTDRCREITEALTQIAFDAYDMQPLKLHYFTMTTYKDSYKNVTPFFNNEHLEHTLGSVLEHYHKTQLRAAETEKYPHVTFFFSGGREHLFKGEHRIMVASPKVATYDLQPEMSALELTDKVIVSVKTQQPDCIILNFANPDMVGHTGVPSAIIKAIETVDHCLGNLLETLKIEGYQALIVADHGNAEHMINEDGSIHTAHTTNPVPCILFNAPNSFSLKQGVLANIAPTLLELLNLPIPSCMTESLIIK